MLLVYPADLIQIEGCNLWRLIIAVELKWFALTSIILIGTADSRQLLAVSQLKVALLIQDSSSVSVACLSPQL